MAICSSDRSRTERSTRFLGSRQRILSVCCQTDEGEIRTLGSLRSRNTRKPYGSLKSQRDCGPTLKSLLIYSAKYLRWWASSGPFKKKALPHLTAFKLP